MMDVNDPKMEELAKRIANLSPEQGEQLQKIMNSFMIYMLEAQNDGIKEFPAAKEFAAKKLKEKYSEAEIKLFNEVIGGAFEMMTQIFQQMNPLTI